MTEPTRSWIHLLLIDLLAGREPIAVNRTDGEWTRACAVASEHGMLGLLARASRSKLEVPPEIDRQLQASALRTAASHRKNLAAAREVLEVLDRGGCEAMILKGPRLVERYYHDPTIRSYGDIDVYVRPERLEASLDAMVAAGYELIDRNWRMLVEGHRGQLHLTSPGGRTVELHWHLVNDARQRRVLGLTAGDPWSWAPPDNSLGPPSFSIDPSTEVAHLCLHTAMHGCNRLIWLYDLAVIAGAVQVDWDAVGTTLRKWRFGDGGWLVLNLLRTWGGAGATSELLDSLRPRPATRRAFRYVARHWDLGEELSAVWSRARELFFASASDTVVTKGLLAADVLVPAPGTMDTSRTTTVDAITRASAGTFQRVMAKARRTAPAGFRSEYAEVGDAAEGQRRYLTATTRAAGARPAVERVVVWSPSSSIGMSHYSIALAEALSAHTQVTLIDGREGKGIAAAARRLRTLDRDGTVLLVTSPHPAVPAALRFWHSGGGFVFHDPILDASSSYTRPLHLLYYRAVTRRLGTVVLHGRVFRSNVVSLRLRARNLVVVPHGFVPDEFDIQAPYDPRGPMVFLGRLHAYKGLPTLIEALRRLHRRGVQVPVVIGGHGITRSMIPEDLTATELLEGEITDERFASLIRETSAVLLPYERANQSGVLATAFRAGRPVIATAVGSFAEYVEDGVNGLLIQPGDPGALAGAIERLRGDVGLAETLARGALNTWTLELSSERSAARILAALAR